MPVVLDFEIWKASNMLFQKMPYEKEEEDKNDENGDFWDDAWHKKFETHDSSGADKSKSGEPEYPPSNPYNIVQWNTNQKKTSQ